MIKHVMLTNGNHFLTDGVSRSTVEIYDHPCFWRGWMALTSYWGLPFEGVWAVERAADAQYGHVEVPGSYDIPLEQVPAAFQKADQQELMKYEIE